MTDASARFIPIQEINYKDEFYIEKLVERSLDKWKETESNQRRLKKLLTYQRDLFFIYVEMALIVSRINEDGAKINRIEDLWKTIRREERKFTESEVDELDSLRIRVNYLVLDVKSLFTNVLIFMDKLARFLSLFIEREGIKSRSFHRFKKYLAKLKGEEIKELSGFVNRSTEWFEEVKDIRDAFIVHHPCASAMMVLGDGKAYATLATTKWRDKIFKNISIEEIDDILSQMKKLLKGLDEHFRGINAFPVKGKI